MYTKLQLNFVSLHKDMLKLHSTFCGSTHLTSCETLQTYAKHVGLRRDFRLIAEGVARNLQEVVEGNGMIFLFLVVTSSLLFIPLLLLLS